MYIRPDKSTAPLTQKATIEAEICERRDLEEPRKKISAASEGRILEKQNPEHQAERRHINRLMLIDDNAIDQKMYQRIIARSNCVNHVTACLSALEALEYLADPANPRIDVILLDINMPRLDGFQFLEEATQRFGTDFAKLVVVMLTTSLDPRDAERASRFDVVRDFLNKPLTQEHLTKIVGYLYED